jgi:hypothetical protein
VFNILFVRCFKILLCFCVSNIFENDVKSDTGLYLDMSHLSPFLCGGFIIAYFKLSGNTPQKAFYYILEGYPALPGMTNGETG